MSSVYIWDQTKSILHSCLPLGYAYCVSVASIVLLILMVEDMGILGTEILLKPI
jgi:hypothetical protein